MKRREGYMATQQDDRGEIQRQISQEEATSTRRIQPIYKWRRRNQTASSSKFTISEKSVHLPRFSVNRKGITSTDALLRSLSSWHQDPKRRHLQISRN